VNFRTLLVSLLVFFLAFSPAHAAHLLKIGQIVPLAKTRTESFPINASDPSGLLPCGRKISEKEAVDWTLSHHRSEIEEASQRTGVPRAVITAMLARERMNDAGDSGLINGYTVVDRTELSTSYGAGNISHEKIVAGLRYAGRSAQDAEAAATAFESHINDRDSIYFAAAYLKSVHDGLLKNDSLQGDLRWDKTIGLYNEGEDKAKGYVFGDYSKSIQRSLNYARTKL
jgi:hypothetical protein